MRKLHEKKIAIGCALAFLVMSSAALAQDAPATPAMEARVETQLATRQAVPADAALKPGSNNRLEVSFARGQLTIDAANSTLRAILAKVAALTGVKFEIPAGASSEHLNVVKLGPGPARQVLASLLYGSDFDYFILASDSDPNGIQSVMLAPRGKRETRSNSVDRAAAARRSSYRTPQRSPSNNSQLTEPSTPTLAQPVSTADAGNSLIPESNLSAQPVLTKAAAQMNRSGLTTEGALSPPTALDRQSIEQQLQHMYQQRAQMMQVINPQATKSASATPAKH